MKVIIAGSRSITDYNLVAEAIEDSGFDIDPSAGLTRELITEVVSGTAQGVDSLGEQWAEKRDIPIKRFKPDWDKYGRKAGFLRNTDMAAYAEALIAVWDGSSRGTLDMIEKAKKNGLKVYVFQVLNR